MPVELRFETYGRPISAASTSQENDSHYSVETFGRPRAFRSTRELAAEEHA